VEWSGAVLESGHRLSAGVQQQFQREFKVVQWTATEGSKDRHSSDGVRVVENRGSAVVCVVAAAASIRL